MTTTVFMLGGAFSGLNNYMPTMLQGKITDGNIQVQVPYNNYGLFVSTVQQGAQMLDSYLKNGSPPMVGFGHSLGAVVCNYWLLHYADDSGIDPDDLSFVWIGNSVSKFGGALGPESGAMWSNWFGNVTVPDDTPFVCRDIKRQYDGWTDWPTGGFNLSAQFNALAGQNSVHPNYQNVDPDPNAPGNVSYTPNVGGSPGKITYIWSMTEPVPTYGTVWDPVVSGLDQNLRSTVESAYNRPVAIPAPTYGEG